MYMPRHIGPEIYMRRCLQLYMPTWTEQSTPRRIGLYKPMWTDCADMVYGKFMLQLRVLGRFVNPFHHRLIRTSFYPYTQGLGLR